MTRFRPLPSLVTALAGALLAGPPHPAAAQEVWTGLDTFFEKPDFADWTQPEHQDRITDAVWITRANTRGIFNIAQESGYTDVLSPVDTEWATGSAAEWETLTFTDWITWIEIPPTITGVDAVVHLISDDVYIDIRFESWTVGPKGGGGGGGFAYRRASPPTPVEPTTWGGVKARMHDHP